MRESKPRRASHKTHSQTHRRQSTPRDDRFVNVFMATGNATKAAIAAGYSAKTASQIASRLLRKVKVQQAIAERSKNDPAVATREERQRFWTAVERGSGAFAKASLKDRLRASELLGRTQGDFIERHDLTTGGQPIVFQVVTNVPQPEGRDAAH